MKKDSFIRQIFTGDNLPILRSMDSETVDLIYLDPPFNSGKQWENPVEAGGHRALASFKDTWELSDSHPDEEYALGQKYPATIPLIDSLYAINRRQLEGVFDLYGRSLGGDAAHSQADGEHLLSLRPGDVARRQVADGCHFWRTVRRQDERQFSQ